MKIAIITDQHFGVRNDSAVFLNNQEQFYNEVFFPYILENNITHVVDLGDTFDRRKYINFNTLDRTCKMWFNKLRDYNIQLDMLVGNHCTYYKSTNRVNSPELLLAEKFPNINIYQDPTDNVMYDDLQVLMMPWICTDNYKQCMEMIDDSAADMMFSHMEISGFQMYRGQHSVGGFDSSLFKKFDKVLSGHYHHKSSSNNITYLGAPYEMTWSDYDDARGFHILDTETRELEYVRNPFSMFHKIKYNDKDVDDYEDIVFDFEQYKDKFVKLIIQNKDNAFWFDKVIDGLTAAGVFHLQVVEDHMYSDLEAEEDIIGQAEDTLDILVGYVDTLDINKKIKKGVDILLRDLYTDALAIT